jgi:Tol biopolymer transport system component
LRLQVQALAKEAASTAKAARVAATQVDTPRVETAPPPAQRTSWLWPAIAAAAVLAAVVLAFLYFRPEPAPAVEVSRFDIAAPEKTGLTDFFAVSPDGRKLAFIATDEDRVQRLWFRSLETGQARALDGTNNAIGYPIWSPDSRSVVFSVGPSPFTLMKVEASGSPPQTLSKIGALPALGGFWTSDNKIVFYHLRAGVQQVSAAGGAPTMLDPYGFASPTLLPDGHHFLYAGVSSADSGVHLGTLDAKPEQQGTRKLLPDISPIAYAPHSGAGSGGGDKGYLLFLRGAAFLLGISSSTGTLMAQPFDSRKLELAGDPVRIAEQVSYFSVSPSGVLVYRTAGSAALQLVNNPPTWFDRQGKVLGPAGEPGVYSAMALSPDEKRIAASRVVPPSVNNDIWLYELAGGVSTRFTFDTGVKSNPVWSPDGSRIVFTSNRAGQADLYAKASNGVGEDQVLLTTAENKRPTSWSRDGRFLLYNVRDAGDLWVLPMSDGAAAKGQKPFLFAPHATVGKFSPDMRWIAYISPESGGNEAWVRPFDATSADGSAASGGKWMVSRGGATSVRWRGDGKELFYAAPDGMIMSVDVTTSPSSPAFGAGVPKPLFKGSPVLGIYWDVSADGKRFLFDEDSAQPARDAKDGKAPPPASPPYKVVLNWQAALKH